MAEKVIIETFGSITKVEMLHTLESNILENTFVVEAYEPFPGYHGENLPSDPIPHHIFLVTKKDYPEETILRVSQKIRKYFKHSFGARQGELHIFNSRLNCIRVKDLSSFELIPELQSCYQSEGIEFMRKRTYNNTGLIKINKYFELRELGDGIFKDLIDLQMFYLEIPDHLNWKLFEQITHSIKNNMDNRNFDAALGVLYRNDLTDVVRIYEKGCSLDKLKQIRKKYIEEIRRYHL
ncbi:MAG: hypothetical protein JSV24_04975 [Bacteroidales bacterium]|nr:MAG: hypothetical protein JSV24_04975 [Bacteroidales bacterium]